MNRYFYSPTTKGFYNEAMHGAREIAGELSEREKKAGKRPQMSVNPACQIPDDAMEIDAERMDQLFAAQASGSTIAQIGGRPVALAIDAEDEAANARRVERDRRLSQSDWTQLPDAPLNAGEKQAWGTYRQKLRDFDWVLGGEWPLAPGEPA